MVFLQPKPPPFLGKVLGFFNTYRLLMVGKNCLPRMIRESLVFLMELK